MDPRPNFPEKNKIEVLNSPEIKIRAISVARICIDGKYLIILDKNSYDEGEVIFGPVGGKMKLTEDGLDEMQKSFGIEKSSFNKQGDQNNDLSFKIEGKNANKYREIFLSGKGRETTPERETFEELVDEWTVLKKEDLDGMNFKRVGYVVKLDGKTPNEKILRLGEVFETKLNPKTIEKLKEEASKKDSPVYLATVEELKAGKTKDGRNIKKIYEVLTNPQKTIEPFV